MRLLLTADTIGGVWTYCMALCEALDPYEIEIALATMGRKLSPEQRWQVGRLPHVTLYESDYRLCWMQDPWEDVDRAGDWLLGIEKEFQPDVVQLNDLAHGSIAWQSPVMVVGHSCVYSWWNAVMKIDPGQDWTRYKRCVSKSVRSADVLVAPTAAMMEALLHHYGPVSHKQVIYNGRDFPPLAPHGFKDANTETFNQSFIFAAGRIWDPAKNIGVLTPIASEISWPVYAAGEQRDPNGGEIIPEGLNCLGFLNSDEMAQWLYGAAIYAAPAHYEPFGLSILEAARAGCALVIGDIASLREVWGDAAMYVNPDNSAEVQQALTQLIDDPKLRHTLSQKAWHRAQRYSAANMARNYVQCYQELSKKSSNKRFVHSQTSKTSQTETQTGARA